MILLIPKPLNITTQELQLLREMTLNKYNILLKGTDFRGKTFNKLTNKGFEKVPYNCPAAVIQSCITKNLIVQTKRLQYKPLIVNPIAEALILTGPVDLKGAINLNIHKTPVTVLKEVTDMQPFYEHLENPLDVNEIWSEDYDSVTVVQILQIGLLARRLAGRYIIRVEDRYVLTDYTKGCLTIINTKFAERYLEENKPAKKLIEMVDGREKIEHLGTKPVFKKSLKTLKLPYGASNLEQYQTVLKFTKANLDMSEVSGNELIPMVSSLYSPKPVSTSENSMPISIFRGITTSEVNTMDEILLLKVIDGYDSKNLGLLISLQNKINPGRIGTTYSARGSVRTPEQTKEYQLFKMYNIKDIIAVSKLATIVKTHPEYNQFHEDIDTELLLSLDMSASKYSKSLRRSTSIRLNALRIISESLLGYFEHEKYEEQMTDYTNSTATIATANMTKLNIKPSHLERMANSAFLGDTFKYVELDDSLDLDKLTMVEDNWNNIKTKLPPLSEPIELRIRKLGKHKGFGLYYAATKTLCIEVKNITGFLHEYGHALDYDMKKSKVTLSLEPEFRDILRSYSISLTALGASQTDFAYWTTPTEVFARGFEIYFDDKVETDLKQSKNALNSMQYAAFNGILEELFEYFDSIF